ncbi:MAG: isoaspartyl peptidase/L-asparaginase [Nevskia sp.]|nr:isoaspartyl peptidase/L-asparaginase [Nevskia sp.]
MIQTANPDPSLIRLALHGGAGDLADGDNDLMRQSRHALRQIAEDVCAELRRGVAALDAVTLAVERLEQCPLFNAGIGAVLNRDGQPELDAAVMRGADRGCGAVASVSRVQSPVRLARAVMEQTPHVLFCGSGAEQLARALGLTMVEPAYFITPLRLQQLEHARRRGAISLDHDTGADAAAVSSDSGGGFGTVGAVARDAYGRLAAATSTGGLTNKLPGRIGDTPLIGVGTFADDRSCAISCTGTGEAFIKAGFAQAIHARMAWHDWDLQRACSEALASVQGYGGRGGCIAIARDGSLQLPFNSNAMYRAWSAADGRVHVAVRADDAD